MSCVEFLVLKRGNSIEKRRGVNACMVDVCYREGSIGYMCKREREREVVRQEKRRKKRRERSEVIE